jgi:hypothetical protein
MAKFSELEFFGPLQPGYFTHIPRYLFEQVEQIKIDLDELYRIGPLCIAAGSMIFTLTDSEHKIKGVLWISANVLEEVLYVQLLSVDKEYQNGEATKLTNEFIQKSGKPIRWATDKPKVFEKKGFKRSKLVLMEINGNEIPDEKSEPDAGLVRQTTGKTK